MPPGLIKDTLPSGDFHLQEERRLFYVGMTRAKERALPHERRGHGRRGATWKVSQFVLEALDLPQGRGAPLPGPAASRSSSATRRRRRRGAGEPAPLPPGRRSSTVSHNQVDDYQTCPLKYQLHPRPAHPAAAAPRRGLRQRPPRGRRVLPEAARGRQLHLARRLPARVRRRLAQRGLPHARARGAAQARGGGGADALLPRGGGVGAEARPTSSRSSASPSAPTRVRGRFDRVDETPEGRVIIDYKSSDVTDQQARRPARAREPAAQDLRARPARDDGATARAASSCASSSRGWPAAIARRSRTWRAPPPRSSRAAAAASARGTSRRRPRTRSAATAPTIRSARAPPPGNEVRRPMGHGGHDTRKGIGMKLGASRGSEAGASAPPSAKR